MKYVYALALLGLPLLSAAQGSTLNRPLAPVVLTGAQLPGLQGLSPGGLVGFRRTAAGSWEQIPVQVDERAALDIVAPYGPQGAGPGYRPDAANPRVLFYCDAATHIGPDPAPAFDADDELVFMAADAGARAHGAAPPAEVVAGSCHEISVTDPLGGGEGYVYLFEQSGRLTPDGGRSYVSYSSDLASTAAFPANAGVTNAENTTISTARYRWHFASEWVSDELRLAVGNNADLLDRHKAFFFDGNCIRNEDTFSADENAFIATKAGPVRAIRSYMGANSGVLTVRTHLFYAGRHDIYTDLRVHYIPSVRDVFDYTPAAEGMIYRNNLNPGGVTVDGRPDPAVVPGDLRWEQLSGPPGTLSILHDRSTTLLSVDAVFTSYYDDNRAAPASNCTGDGEAWGSSGPAVDFLIDNGPCTDPLPGNTCSSSSHSYRTLSLARILYADGPTAPPTQAAAYRQQHDHPLQISAAAGVGVTGAQPGGPGARLRVYPNPAAGQATVQTDRAYQLRVYNALGQCLRTQAVPAGTSALLLPESGLLQLVFTAGKERRVLRQLMR
jgi:hypothetical protein